MLHTHYLDAVSQLGMGVMRMPQTEPGLLVLCTSCRYVALIARRL